MRSAPYTLGRARPGFRGGGGRRASRRAFRAWSRCHPVRAHSSSRILPRSVFVVVALWYLVAISLVTALRCPIVSPTWCLLPLREPGEGSSGRGHP
jgi:hypothetical protein